MNLESFWNMIKSEIEDLMYMILEKFFNGKLAFTNIVPSPIDNSLLTFDEAVKFFKISKPTMYNWIKKKILPVVIIEGRRYIRKSDIDNLVNNSVVGLPSKALSKKNVENSAA